MASWITHLIIADKLLLQFPDLNKRSFCVGNIAPDCNIENTDFTAFIPPREVTHFMSGTKKADSDSDTFYQKYIVTHNSKLISTKHYSFLLGYYSHLLTDFAFQRFIRDETRVRAVWLRIKQDENLKLRTAGYHENWDSIKKIFDKNERMHEIYSMEAEYLHDNPQSGYLTEILPLKTFPDYLDFLPNGCIVRKIGVMSYIPEIDEKTPVTMSREEFTAFANQTANLVADRFKERKLV